METNFYLVIILAFLVGGYALEAGAELLNLKSLRSAPPEELKDLYDPERYAKSQQYQRETTQFGLVHQTVSLILLVGFILAGGFNRVDQLARSFDLGSIATGLIFVGILTVLRFLVQLPFSIYGTFVIEEKYGFNRTTYKVFVLDILRGALIGGVLGATIFAAVVYFFEQLGPDAWIWAWALVVVFQIILLFLAPAIILPLFNRFEPIPEGELRTAIENYARDQNFELSGVYTMDGSKRSTKANAFFTGFGSFRRLVLFDTLVQKHTKDELMAVLAHEVGHFKCRHIPKLILISVLSTGLTFWFFSLLIGNEGLFGAFRMEHVSIYASLVFIGFLYGPIVKLISVFTNALSRRFEFEADRFSARTYGKPDELISALKKLSADNLSHLSPHPLKVVLDYTHPPLARRINALRRKEFA